MNYCKLNALRTVSNITFSKRLRQQGFDIVRRSEGNVVYYRERPNDVTQETQPVNVEASAPAKRPVRSIPNKKRNDTLPEIHPK